MRQLALQILMRPSYALLDICGPVPPEYIDGDLVLPVYIPNNKIFTCLITSTNAKAKIYDPDTYIGEIGNKNN
jgi:hypothetical protein